MFRASTLELHRKLFDSNKLLLGVSGIYNEEGFIQTVEKLFKK